jgi:hypothetical protein
MGDNFMHDCRDHIHHEADVEKLDKETMNKKLNDQNQFKGFDDFMYFSYKYWPLITTDPENIAKAEQLFVELIKKFNKINSGKGENISAEIEKYTSHLDEVTGLIKDHDAHTATITISRYIKPFTIQDKFIRNFNKKVASAEI